jgi:hypothetical protein
LHWASPVAGVYHRWQRWGPLGQCSSASRNVGEGCQGLASVESRRSQDILYRKLGPWLLVPREDHPQTRETEALMLGPELRSVQETLARHG